MPNSESKKNPIKQVKPIRKRKSKYINMDSTKRKLVNEGKNAPDAKFRNFLDNLGDIVYEADTSGNVTYANKVAEKMTGIPLDDIIGKPFLPLFTKESQLIAIDVYEKTLNGESAEYELTFTNGRVCHFKNEPLRNENGQVAGVFGIARDITERKRVEKTLRDSEERFKNLFNNSLVGLYRTTPDGRILMANPALVRMLGYDSFEELARRNLEDEGYHPEYPRSVFKERISRESKVIGLESAWKRADGTTLYIRESAQAVRDESGNIMYYQGTVEDITEHRRITMALQSSEEMFETLVANMNEGVDIVDDNLYCKFANPAGEEIFGVEAGGLVGRTLYEFISEEGHKRIEEQLSKRREGVASSYDLEIIRPDGQKRQLIVTGTPRFSKDGKYIGALGIFFDVTKRKESEEALRKAHDELEMRVQERTAELQQANEVLRERELSLNLALQVAQLGHWDWHIPTGRIVCSDEIYHMFGVQPEQFQFTYERFFEFIHPSDREFVRTKIQVTLFENKLLDMEFRILTAKGQERILHCQAASFKNRAGEPLRMIGTTHDITEHREAHRQMHERAKIIDLTTDSVIKTNRDGIVTMWNRGAERIFGYTSEEMIGQPIGTLYREQEQGRLAEIVETLLRGEEITTTEVTCVHKNGSLIELALSVLPFKDDNGNVTDFVGISKDISDRKKAQEALLRSENRYRTVIENAGEGIVVVQDGMLRFINSQQTSVAGRSQEESMSRPFIEFVHPDDRQRVAEFHTARLRGEHVPSVYEFRIIDKNGRTKWLENNGVLIEWNGRPASLNFLRDITTRKNAEEALREREEMIRAMVETSRDWIWSIDLNGVHTYCNPAVERILGYSPDELVRKRSLDLIHNDDRRTIEAILPTWIAEKRGWSNLMLRWKHKDGTYRYLESNAVPILSSENELVGFRGVDRDITERMRTEDTLRQYKFMVESAHDAIFFKDLQSKYIIANKKTLESFGLPREKVIGKSDYEIMPKREQANNNINDDKVVFETGKPKEIIKEMTDADGKLYWFQAIKVPHFDENGNVIGLIGIARDITERIQAEEELKIREQQLRALLNAPTESAILVDVNGTILDINRIAAQRVGKSVEELIGTRIYDYFPSGIAEFRKAKGEEVISSGKPLRFNDEREGHYYDNNLYPVFDDKGKVNAVAVFSQDITERKQADQALRESEEKFRSLAEQSPNMIFINRGGKIVYVNNKCEEVMGYKREEFCSPDFDFRNLVVPESLELINDKFTRHLRGEEVHPYDYSILTKDGERIEAINASKLIHYEGQTAILGVVTDITERKKSEQALRESEERLKVLFESAPDAIYLIDSEGRFVDGNKAAEDLIGLEKSEVIGKSLAELGLLPAGQLSKAQTNLRKVAAGKLSGPNEYTLKRQDGSHISVEVRTFPVKIEGRLLTLGIARDITEHKRTEKKLLEHQAKLKSLASRLSLVEERERYRLATDLHDQISQSLVISKIKLDQLSKSSDSEEFNKSLKDISNCLGQVIDDTRALTFDLSYPILYELGFEAAVAEWLNDQIQVKHGIETEFVDDGHKKPLDDDIRVLLFRNVRELLINVVKHAQPKKVKVSISRIKDNIRVSVEDDGIGFDPVEVMSMSAKRAEFGLFSVRERLEQLGGLIEIDSEIGRGSKITMTAPLKN